MGVVKSYKLSKKFISQLWGGGEPYLGHVPNMTGFFLIHPMQKIEYYLSLQIASFVTEMVDDILFSLTTLFHQPPFLNDIQITIHFAEDSIHVELSQNQIKFK